MAFVEILGTEPMLIRVLFGAAGVLNLFACTANDPGLDIYLAVTQEQDERPLGLFQPRFTDCPACEVREFRGPGGASFSAIVESKPRLSIERSEIKEVRVGEIRSVREPEVGYWVALAIPRDDVRTRLQRLSEVYSFDRVLVAWEGVPIDIHGIATWSRGVRIGAFRTRDDVQEFVSGLDLPVAWVPLDEQQLSEDRAELERLIDLAP